VTFRRNPNIAAAVFSVLGSLSIGPSWAGDAEPESASEPIALQEITVTAQRRAENSQRVPIAIDTVSGAALQERGAVSVQTLSSAVPNLTTTGSFNTNMFIRGVGSSSVSPNVEPSVATYVDGVYMPSQFGMSGFAFNNIERLEVLKGPQGTLFGRNATAGVVQIITPDPRHDFSGNVMLGYGNYDTIDGSGYLTGGLGDNLATDLSVMYENERAGYGRNLSHDTDIFIYQNVAARSKWLYTPAEATRVTMTLDWSQYHSDGSNNQLLPGSYGIDGVTTYPGKYNAYGTLNSNDYQQYGVSARIDQDMGPIHGASITAYRNENGTWLVDNDLGSAPLITVSNYNDANYVTQEFQLSNKDPGRITWLAGAFFYGNQVENAPQATYGTRVTPNQYSGAYGLQRTRSASGFAQATAEVWADTKLTLGLRYTDETLHANTARTNSIGTILGGPYVSQINYQPWTWRMALDHQFNSDVLGYVSYNRGFKSGGYNLSNPGTAAFLPETLDAYEVGMKSEVLGHRVRLNLAVFDYEYKNIQVSIAPGNGTQIFTNAAGARNSGLDASLDFVVTDNLTFSAGLGLLKAKYTDYPDAIGYTNRGSLVLLANARGQSLPYAPPVSSYVSGNYRVPTSVGEFDVTASLSYNDRSYISPTEQPERPTYFLLSSSAQWWSTAVKPVGVRLWGRNLTNAYYPRNLISSANGWYQSPAPPRTYGLMLLKKF
jgi:iron complex outermembrane receptor protein